MKNIIFRIATALTASLYLFGGNSVACDVKIGADFGGTLTVESSVVALTSEGVVTTTTTEDFGAGTGVAVTVECAPTINKYFDMGLGAGYQMSRSASSDNLSVDFGFVPVYLLVRAHPEKKEIMPYLVGQLGMSLLLGDVSLSSGGDFSKNKGGGVHTAAGAGIAIKKKFLFEALYSTDKGTIFLYRENPRSSAGSISLELSRFIVYAGYRF